MFSSTSSNSCQFSQYFQYFSSFFDTTLQNNIQREERRVNFIETAFRDFDLRITEINNNLEGIFEIISQKVKENIRDSENQLDIAGKLLVNCDYKNVLKRGYALLSDDKGFVKYISDLENKDNIFIEMQDGKREVKLIK